MGALELSEPVFAILNGLIEEKVGIHYRAEDRELLHEKASARALEAGFESLLDYYYYLRYDAGGGEELSALIESLVVGETYFFREWPALEVLVHAFVEPWCAAGRRPRIWCAACASGEEPLSLAMLLHSRGILDRVELVASDVSARAIVRAQQGRYRKRSLRHIPRPELASHHLHEEGEGYCVSPELVGRIAWLQRNLVDDRHIETLGRFDVVLCRNVLIYFSDRTVRAVLDRIWRLLVADGVLLVGVSESLLRYGTRFVAEEVSGSFVYRKRDLG
jgi:chemotaxis protein methyltransferase CheR